MRLRLIHKLLIALFASTALVLLLTVALTRFSIGRGFEDFLRRQELARLEAATPELAAWYETNEDWDALARAPHEFHDLLRDAIGLESGGRGTGGGPPGRRRGREVERPEDHPGTGRRGPVGMQRTVRGDDRPHPPRGPGMALGQRVFLLDEHKRVLIGEPSPAPDSASLLPIEHAGAVVGWLGVHPFRGQFAPEEQAFLHQQRNTLLVGLGGGLLVAALLAWLLARHLGRPVSAAAGGIHALAAGDYAARVDIRGQDEIAELGNDVNRLAVSLSEHENARQRWMADIAHELRTPLAIIRGELEAMTDGIRPMNAESLASVSEEVQHLKALIDDLRKLALSDSGALAYKMEALDLAALVASAVETARGLTPDKRLDIQWRGPGEPLLIHGDEKRLRQLLHNLLENSIRYTDVPGRVEITLEKHGPNAVLQVSDSAPGAPEPECAMIFERFHRLEASRNRGSGGSGLGLAICRNIVQAHGGSIEARPGPLGGLVIIVSLPVGR